MYIYIYIYIYIYNCIIICISINTVLICEILDPEMLYYDQAIRMRFYILMLL